MSYARFGWDGSSVYVYKHVHGHLECCGCLLNESNWEFHSTADMVEHLECHIAVGHHVPSHVIPELLADDAENFPPSVEGGGTS